MKKRRLAVLMSMSICIALISCAGQSANTQDSKQSMQQAPKATVEKMNIAGTIIKTSQGYVIRGEVPKKVFRILNPDPGILDEFVESGRTYPLKPDCLRRQMRRLKKSTERSRRAVKIRESNSGKFIQCSNSPAANFVQWKSINVESFKWIRKVYREFPGVVVSLEELVRNYGYIIIVIGTFLEGETILVVAGFLAYSGYLQLPFVILAGFAGTFAGDQLYFYLGRYQGKDIH